LLISQHLIEEAISVDLKGQNLKEVLLELAKLASVTNKKLEAASLGQALIEREELLSTASGAGVSFPHCYLKIKKPCFALGISQGGISADAPDGKLVHIFLVVISPEKKPELHLEALSAASSIFLNKKCKQEIIAATTNAEVIKTIATAEG
jgi:mannitol/fructose-specific phosphotransferase system IIA component (Ntr-type)